MVKQCLMRWENAVCEGGGSFSLQPGCTPSRATLRFRLGADIPQFGTLIITDGSSTRTVKDCRVVRQRIGGAGGGPRYREVTIEDSRWRWSYSCIWGKFNTDYSPSGLLNKKSAYDIALMLLQAIGITNYDASALPADDYPAVDWSAEPAGAALESLCGQYGLVIAPQMNGAVLICSAGVGRKPPLDSRAMDVTESMEPPVVPDVIIFEGDQTNWQADLVLEPVGYESFNTTSELKHIDSLSYKPAGGWTKQDPKTFLGVDSKYRELAKACIWKLYRIKEGFTPTFPPSRLSTAIQNGTVKPGAYQATRDYYQIKTGERWRILPLNTEQLRIMSSSAADKARPALVFGFFRNDKQGTTNNFDDATIAAGLANIQNVDYTFPKVISEAGWYGGSFTIDTDVGVVQFSEPLFRWVRTASANVERYPALLRLRTSFPVRDRTTAAELCQQFRYDVPRSSRQGIVDVIKRDDISFEIDPYGGTSEAEYIAAAQVVIQASVTRYVTDTAMTVPYKGFVFDCELDGAIQSVTWEVSDSGGGTTAIDYLCDRPDLRVSTKQLYAWMQGPLAANKAQRASIKQLRAQRKVGRKSI